MWQISAFFHVVRVYSERRGSGSGASRNGLDDNGEAQPSLA